MSGHSKWANIKHKKEASDKKKGKIFSKLAKEIMVCVKQSGKDPNSNPRLRMALIESRYPVIPRSSAAAKTILDMEVATIAVIARNFLDVGDREFTALFSFFISVPHCFHPPRQHSPWH